MTTIPARLAQRTVISSSLAESRARSRALYRDYYRSAPEICTLYALDVPPSTLRAKIRTKFEERKHITDMAVLDVMLHKGRVDYQETMNAWKQLPQVMKLFAQEEVSPRLGERVVVVVRWLLTLEATSSLLRRLHHCQRRSSRSSTQARTLEGATFTRATRRTGRHDDDEGDGGGSDGGERDGHHVLIYTHTSSSAHGEHL